MENWFVPWFNSPYYHILYKNRDYAEAAAFIDTLTDHLNLPHGAKVLDLACGKGRHSAHLRKNGFEVVGIDLSEESIALAKEEFEQDGLEFYEHDMRELYWTEYFDLVVNLFTSFGYFHSEADDQKTISSIADALKPDGLLVIDFLNAVKVKNKLVEEEEKVIDDVRFAIERSVESGIIKKKIRVFDGQVELEFEEKVDALELDNFKAYFDGAELELIETFGDYKLNPFSEEESDRLITVCRKA
ncbi:MAG: class I SAM-dependent methyltransferase [Flavobacteriales bacterium]|nr:class I SAM-dependent methyltransferase [Flavobacteriales bacterium]